MPVWLVFRWPPHPKTALIVDHPRTQPPLKARAPRRADSRSGALLKVRVSVRFFSEHDAPAVWRHGAKGKQRLRAYLSKKNKFYVLVATAIAYYTNFHAIGATGLQLKCWVAPFRTSWALRSGCRVDDHPSGPAESEQTWLSTGNTFCSKHFQGLHALS